ncbi:CDK5 regulatory subunit associated protein 3 L homeolog [Xenopus laevis]|uniref:CDK5 regulatory subunit associated protein 3 L homeolog n=1 Tax=Xenopus laevis TaxID=8355 RepID=Q6AZH9_XENLA|nr:CDK5 regulatory subunit associated protein 3 L homeolog [Xenopus laevis]AAH77996.1 MGC82350 protein [Xenopus laevis]
MQDVQNLPIDIQTGRLLDWLVDRRHCTLKWQSKVLQIREKINQALQDMPEHDEIRSLLSGTYINYFHCLKIVEILKGTEAATRNLFGRYSSQRMKDWQEVVSLYQADNTYLGESASLFMRSVSYEIPALKKQMTRCEQLSLESERRAEECLHGAAQQREQYYNSCKNYGISGEDIRKELVALVCDVPSVLRQIGADAAGLLSAIQLYQACVTFVCDSSPEEALPILRHVQKCGDTTIYEWRVGEAPRRVERPDKEKQETPQCPEEGEINWGDFEVQPSTAAETEAGLDSLATGEIDWGISVEPEAAEVDGINWDAGEEPTAVITVLETGSNVLPGVARGSDALSVLENTDTRNQFVDELMELELFLCQWQQSMECDTDIVTVTQFQTAPSILQGQTQGKVLAMISVVRGLISRLTDTRMRQLFLILASPRYVDRVTDHLGQRLRQAQLLEKKSVSWVERGRAAQEERQSLEPRLSLLQERSRELKKQIEADLSKRYNNRPVNLIGTGL